MAKPQQDDGPRGRKKVVSRAEIIILAVIGFVLLSFGLQKCGLNVVKTTDDTELIHKPHQNR